MHKLKALWYLLFSKEFILLHNFKVEEDKSTTFDMTSTVPSPFYPHSVLPRAAQVFEEHYRERGQWIEEDKCCLDED